MPSLQTQLQTARNDEIVVDRKLKKNEDASSSSRIQEKRNEVSSSSKAHHKSKIVKSQEVSHRQKRLPPSGLRRHYNAEQEFQRALTMIGAKVFTDHESLPSYENAFVSFRDTFPRYNETSVMDTLRSDEYSHLEDNHRVCLDYCGFGLFSHRQQVEQWDSASFALSNLSVNLYAHALFGAAEEGTVECDIRKRIMTYLNISESDYSMVFTASRGSSFKLLADAYPFETCNRLITMYDYESESVSWMVQRAKEKGAKVSSAAFKLPTLRIVSTKLKKLLVARQRRRGPTKGLFVFPMQSRVTGVKYSYQWMSLAQQNKWHVLLDASAIGPKDMDSLGLSLFKPDFIITSFYKVFGSDPSGFGCLFIKNSVMQRIQDEAGKPASGIVRIVPYPDQRFWSQSSEGDQHDMNELEDDMYENEESADIMFQVKGNELSPMVPSFSGPMLGFNRQDSSEEISSGLPRTEGGMEDDDDETSVCDSVGEVIRSPIFSDDGTDNLFCIDVGPSPLGQNSMFEDASSEPFSGSFSGPLSGPLHGSDGATNVSRSACHDPLFEGSSAIVNGIEIVDANKKLEDDYTYGAMKDEPVKSQNMCILAPSKSIKLSVCHVELRDPGKSPLPSLCEDSSKVEVVDNQYVLCTDSINRHNPEEAVTGINLLQSPDNTGKTKVIDRPKDMVNIAFQSTESAIRRETEGEFMLLGRRTGDRWKGGSSLSPILQEAEELDSGVTKIYNGVDFAGDLGSSHQDNEGTENFHNNEWGEVDGWDAGEPEVVCRSLDHADMLGLNKTTIRLRYLINWLVCSLLQLRYPGPEDNLPLIQLYGPRVKFDRGACIAFNLYDCHGNMLHPELVQTLADKNDISLSIGFLRNLRPPDNTDVAAFSTTNKNTFAWGDHRKGAPQRVEVVTAALSILSNFEDVYRLWAFIAKFLDADFVSKEHSRYPAHVGD
ncbi:hypothetical protein KP509_27G039100 [Ceratopteris richardii]|nr:hypothetical protein KP509_27G039100 [Ceratopteris richardii]